MVSLEKWLKDRGFNTWEEYQEAQAQAYREASAKIIQMILGIAVEEQKIDPKKILIDHVNEDGSSTLITWRQKKRADLWKEEDNETRQR